MSEEQEIVRILTLFGLSGNDIKVLTTLAKFRYMKVGQIARETGIPRTETYRVLKKLENLGLVHAWAEYPKKFSSMEVEHLIKRLLAIERRRISRLESEKVKLVNALKSIAGRSKLLEEEKRGVCILVGKQQVYERKIRLCKMAKHKIDYMFSCVGLRRDSKNAIISTLRSRSKKIKIRIISEINKVNLHEAILFNKFSILRHAPRISSHIMIADGEQTVVEATINEMKRTLKMEYHTDIWTNSREWVKLYQRFFEEMWNNSISIDERIKELREPSKAFSS